MDEVFGIIDALESTILEGKKVPFSEKIVIEEKKLLSLVDKLRLVLKSDGNMIKRSINASEKDKAYEKAVESNPSEDNSVDKNTQILEEAVNQAEKIKTGANEYADYVLANLHLMVTKMQTNLVKIEKSLTNGRDALDQTREKEEVNI